MIFGSAFTQRLGQFLRRTAGLGVLGRKEGREMPPHDLGRHVAMSGRGAGVHVGSALADRA